MFENPDQIPKNYQGFKKNNKKSRDINFFRIKVSSLPGILKSNLTLLNDKLDILDLHLIFA